MSRLRTRLVASFAVASLVVAGVATSTTLAQPVPSDGFSLEVSPSPLIATVKPGKASTFEIKVRNASAKPEQLKIESRNFDVKQSNQEVSLSNTASSDLKQWVSYSAPTFTVGPGEWFTQEVTINLPEQAGFSYPFAILISRQSEDTSQASGSRLIQGSIAVFTLVNVDKPGATRKLELASFTTNHPVYEYLPTTLSLKLKNTGNSIAQPYGNFYIQRSASDTSPLAALPVNDTKTYILPGATKQITAKWSDGYPVYEQKGSEQHLEWDLAQAGHFRIGKYTAKVVAVYNDGTRDVPIVGEVTFWVIPWKILLGILVVTTLIGAGVWSLVRRIIRKIFRRGPAKQA